MQQENLLRMQDAIGRKETIQLLKLAISQDLPSKLNASFRNGRYEEAQLYMVKSLGSVFLYGSPKLVELFQQGIQGDLSRLSKKEIDAFKHAIDKAFKQTFLAIADYINLINITEGDLVEKQPNKRRRKAVV